MFLESTQNQRCFNVEFYRWIKVDKSTLNQRGYHVDWPCDVISTYVNVESTLSVYWDAMIILTFILSSNFSQFGFKFKTGLTSQFTTYHLPLADGNDYWEWFLKSTNLKMHMELQVT